VVCWMCSTPAENSPRPERLFFALWPDATLRQQIKRHCKALLRHAGGRPVSLENMHITLAFLGTVDARQRACVEAMADAIRCPPFSLCLDQAGHWARSRVLWIAPRQAPAALTTLATALSDGARECGLNMELRPYHAHLSLKRKLVRAPQMLDFRPLHWHATHFVLVRSVTWQEGVQYEVVREWPLHADAAEASGL